MRAIKQTGKGERLFLFVLWQDFIQFGRIEG
jgi:hypothetical protein